MDLALHGKLEKILHILPCANCTTDDTETYQKSVRMLILQYVHLSSVKPTSTNHFEWRDRKIARIDPNADNCACIPNAVRGLSVGNERARCADRRIDTEIVGQSKHFFSDLVELTE